MSSFNTDGDERVPSSAAVLSSRAQRLIAAPPLSYITELIKGLQNQFHPESNPSGAVLLAVAENKLCCDDLLLPKIRQYAQEAPSYVLNYTSTFGLPALRERLSLFLSRRLFRNSSEDKTFRIDPEQLVVGAGCVAHLISLSLLLFEPGDAVLTPAPYYPAFDKDFLNFGDAVVVPVHGDHARDDKPFGELTRAALERTFTQTESESGRRVRALLLTNPSNPLGSLYSKTELLETIEWVKERKIHLIVDEIYALSLFATHRLAETDSDAQKDEPVFESVVSLLQNELGDYVHFVWSFSKDFGGSGLRVGVLYSQNASLLRALGATNDAMMASNLTQYTLQRILEDEDWVSMYLRENSRRLFESFSILREHLEDIGVRVHATHGAIFAFCDFRRYLEEHTFEAERKLFQKLNAYGVLFTPGESCRSPIPGFFRVCYAFVSVEGLREGLRRVKAALLDSSDGGKV